MRNRCFEAKSSGEKGREKNEAELTFPAERIWNMDQLREQVCKAILKFGKDGESYFYDRHGYRACMVIPIIPGSYYQTREIAEIFGLEYDELTMNEDELDSLRERMRFLSSELLQDLHDRVHLPLEFSFSLGHDPEGNFGLILRKKAEAKVPCYPLCKSC
jgi:hypothetical protein